MVSRDASTTARLLRKASAHRLTAPPGFHHTDQHLLALSNSLRLRYAALRQKQCAVVGRYSSSSCLPSGQRHLAEHWPAQSKPTAMAVNVAFHRPLS
jgi:hypothetical protein